MSDALELEHLRAIRSDIAKHRLTAAEIAVAHLAATEANHYASLASTIDRLEERTERLEIVRGGLRA